MKSILFVIIIYTSFTSCIPNNNQYINSIDEFKMTDSNLIYDIFENILIDNYTVIGSLLFDSILSFYKLLLFQLNLISLLVIIRKQLF
jgi:hypothetical protein